MFNVFGCMPTCICFVFCIGKRGGGGSSVNKDRHLARHK